MTELDRLTRIAERRLTRRRAAELLQLSERQVRRLARAFARAGAAGVTRQLERLVIEPIGSNCTSLGRWAASEAVP
jgi:hypothetical protein